MAKNAVTDWSTTAANNTDVGGIGIQGSSSLSSGDDALREIMAQIAKLISSPDAGAAVAPIFPLFRDSASPAASDILGALVFRGRDSAGNIQDYAEIYATILDATSTSEDGRVFLRAMVNGTMTTIATLDDGAITFVRRLDMSSLSTSGILLPRAAVPAPTTDGDLRYGTTRKALYIGNGASANVISPNAWELISTQTPAAAGSVVWTDLSVFRALKLTGFVKPSSDGVGIGLRTSTNNGSSYDASTGYLNQDIAAASSTVAASLGSADSAAFLYAGDSVGNATEEGIAFDVTIEQFNQTTYCWFLINAVLKNASGAAYRVAKASFRQDTTARNALQLLPFSGNITGRVTLEGIRG